MTVTVTMRKDESLAAALLRAGLKADQAWAASAVLADAFDTINPHPGLALSVTVSSALSPGAERQLMALSFNPDEDVQVSLSRGVDDALRVRRTETSVVVVNTLVEGVVEGSLYLSLIGKGVEPTLAAKVAGLFGRDLDLSRDVRSGDRFRLVVEQRRRTDGRLLGPPDLLYADLSLRSRAVRLYRAAPGGSASESYVSGDAVSRPAPALLRTPVAGARVSSGFGLRLHPILGFTRMHQGLDFAAPLGSPVVSAGDGVVEEEGWIGGYGRWLKIRHAAGLETGYAHLSAWAAAIAPGDHVRQGQVVAYVGASGLATGPHLHYEIFDHGRRIDPQSLQFAKSDSQVAAQSHDFKAWKARIDATVATLACTSDSSIDFGVGQCLG